MPIPLRSDFNASGLRALARRTKDVSLVRRLLALAAIYEGTYRTEAAQIRGVIQMIESRAISAEYEVVRWRLIDLIC